MPSTFHGSTPFPPVLFPPHPSRGSGGDHPRRRRGKGKAAPLLAAGGLFCLLIIAAASVLALDVPRLTGRVNDYAHMLSPEAVQRLDATLADFERTDSTQVVVLTIPSLQDESLEEYSIKVAQAWGIGRKGRDNGAVLLVSKGDRKVRIEVGYGLEGVLTDALSGRIISQAITPAFKEGNFDAGVENGVAAIIQATRGEYQGDPAGDRSGQGHDDNAFFALFILALILSAVLSGLPALARAGIFGVALPAVGALFGMALGFLLLLLIGGVVLGLLGPFLFRSGRGGGGGFFIGGGGGASGGGGFSGGGGSFGGGGASGSW